MHLLHFPTCDGENGGYLAFDDQAESLRLEYVFVGGRLPDSPAIYSLYAHTHSKLSQFPNDPQFSSYPPIPFFRHRAISHSYALFSSSNSALVHPPDPLTPLSQKQATKRSSVLLTRARWNHYYICLKSRLSDWRKVNNQMITHTTFFCLKESCAGEGSPPQFDLRGIKDLARLWGCLISDGGGERVERGRGDVGLRGFLYDGRDKLTDGKDPEHSRALRISSVRLCILAIHLLRARVVKSAVVVAKQVMKIFASDTLQTLHFST